MNFIEIFANVPAGTVVFCSLLGNITYQNTVGEDLYFNSEHGQVRFNKEGKLYLVDLETYSRNCVLFVNDEEDGDDWDEFADRFRNALPVDTPVVIKQAGRNFPYIAYWAGNNSVWKNGLKSTQTQEKMSLTGWCVPLANFDANNVDACVAEFNVID